MRVRAIHLVSLALAATLVPRAPAAADVTQQDIDALERDLSRVEEGERRDELLAMLMEGLAERCFPDDSREANPVVRDDWSRTCLDRAVEVAEEILGRPEHPGLDRALFVAGKGSIALRRPSAGRDYLERFVADHPDAAEAPLAHYSLAELSWDEDAFALAVPHYRAAARGLPAERSVIPRYRLAWSLHRSGETHGAIVELADLLSAGIEMDEEVRGTALTDLEALARELGDPAATLDALARVHGEAAPDRATAVAGALVTDGQTPEALAHFTAMIGRWPGRIDAASWQVGIVDAAWAMDDVALVCQGLEGLREGYGPASEFARTHGSGADGRRAALQVEEASRSGVARLHQRRREVGSPDVASLEAAYRGYLRTFVGAERAADVRIALAALLHEEGRPLEAVDEMLGVVEEYAGRERGAQAARVAAEHLAAVLPDRGGEGPLDPSEERLVRLAEIFAEGYPRHPDGAAYLARAGTCLVERGQREQGEALWLDVTRRHPTEVEARAVAASLVEARLTAEDWSAAVEMARELLEDERLAAAHADLAEILGRGRATARFNRAHQLWEQGDPAAAALEFEAVSADRAAGDLLTRALFYAGTCQAESGNGSRAGLTLRRLYTRHPDDEMAPAARELEANLRWEREDYNGAAGLFRALADAYPDHEKASYALYTSAALFDQEGRFDEAIEGYRALLERYPDVVQADEVTARLGELEP